MALPLESIPLNEPIGDSGVARCPRCGFEFKPWLVMQVRDVAVMFGVKVSTVQHWIARAGLPQRIWRLGSIKVRRIILGDDLVKWMDTKLARPGDGSETAALWSRVSERGKLGAAARERNKAQRAALIGPPPPTDDHTS